MHEIADGDVSSDLVPRTLNRVRRAPRRGNEWSSAAYLAAAAVALLVVLSGVALALRDNSHRPAAMPSASPTSSMDSALPPPTATPPLTTDGAPTSRPSPSPLGQGLPLPPPDFDPADIRWYGSAVTASSVGGYPEGLWLGWLDGSGLVRVTASNVTQAAMLADGRLAYATSDGTEGRLYLFDPSTGEETLLAEVGGDWAIGTQAAFVARYGNADEGVWRVALDGRSAEMVLPAAGDDRAYGPVSSQDGRRVARGVCATPPRPQALNVWVEGALHALPVGRPIGFDVMGRVIAFDQCEGGNIATYDPQSGEVTVLMPHFGQDPVIKRAGERLAAWITVGVGRHQHPNVFWIDTTTGETQSWELTGYSWRLTDLGGDRYLVLEGSPAESGHNVELPGEQPWVAVIDVEEGWVGYMRPREGP